MSIIHIQSAAILCQEARLLESNNHTSKFEMLNIYQAKSIGAIWAISSFLEAYINEIYCDIYDDSPEFVGSVPENKKNLIAKMWSKGIPRTAKYSILDKYDIFLDLMEIKGFSKGEFPYQDIQLLIKLRNSLIHYEPEWVKNTSSHDFNDADMHKFEKKLKGKFTTNPFTGEGNAFYPDKCIGYGCAKWGFDASIALTEEFSKKSGVKITYGHVKNNLEIA